MIFISLKKYWKPLTAVFFWGLSFIATKFALRDITPMMIINLRLLISIPLIGAIAYGTKRSFAMTKHQAFLIALLAAISVFHLFIQVTGIRYTSAVNTGWIIGTTPVFIALLSRIFLKEYLSRTKIWGIVIAVIGLLWLISKGDLHSLSFISGIGDLLVLASCATWGFFTVVNRKISLNYSPMVSTFYLFVFMAVMTLPFNLDASSFILFTRMTLSGWLGVLFLGIFCSGISYALWAQSLSEMQSVNAAAFLYLEPFVTFAGSWIILGEPITAVTIISGLIIMTGVAIVNRTTQRIQN
jgi:drug/metabolite transporter (DMT)-like permease